MLEPSARLRGPLERFWAAITALTEPYEADTFRYWWRLFGSVVFFSGWISRTAPLTWLGAFVYILLFIAAQTYLNEPKASTINWSWITNPALRSLAPSVFSVGLSVVLILPWIIAKFKDKAEKRIYQELVDRHLWGSLHAELKGIRQFLISRKKGYPGCSQTIRVNLLLVKRIGLSRRLVHALSSDPDHPADREVTFFLDEGIVGCAYARKGNIEAWDYPHALRVLRESTRQMVTQDHVGIAARAIGEDKGVLGRSGLNTVYGVIAITSDDASDLTKLDGPSVRDVLNRHAVVVRSALKDIRRAVDGY